MRFARLLMAVSALLLAPLASTPHKRLGGPLALLITRGLIFRAANAA